MKYLKPKHLLPFLLLISSCNSFPREVSVPIKTMTVTLTPTLPTKMLTPSMTPSPTQTIKATIPPNTPTQTLDIVEYMDKWVQYESKSLGIRFEYPYLYNFPAAHPNHDDWVKYCKPTSFGDNGVHVGDWMIISINDYDNEATPTPFSGLSENWITDSINYIEVGGEDAFVVIGREPIVWDDDISDALCADIGFATIMKGNQIVTIYYRSSMTGTPICLYNYNTISVEDLFLHIIESFEFLN